MQETSDREMSEMRCSCNKLLFEFDEEYIRVKCPKKGEFVIASFDDLKQIHKNEKH